MPTSSASAPQDAARGSAWSVFLAFLRLGLTSFGGPVAHLGYFRTEFVERRRWLDDRSFSDLVALCQFLPGPASSQVGIAVGMARAGWAGSLAAWCGFTLPSAFALIAFAYGIARYAALAQSGAVHGLKVVAVAVVAQAVWGMAKSLCPDRPRGGLAVAATLVTGVVNTWLVLGAWPLDFASPYQALLALKIALVMAMVGIALYNRYVSTPRLAGTPERAARALVRGTIAEIVLGTGIIALVSAFATFDPV